MRTPNPNTANRKKSNTGSGNGEHVVKPKIGNSSKEHVVKPKNGTPSKEHVAKPQNGTPSKEHVAKPQVERQRTAKKKTVSVKRSEPVETKRSAVQKAIAKERARAFLQIVKRIVISVLCIVAMAGVVFAFAYFGCSIETVHVEGSQVYTDEEIAAYVLDDEYSWNAVYVMLRSFFKPTKDIPLVKSVVVYMNGLHDITISVVEKDYKCVMDLSQTECPQLEYIRSVSKAEDEATEQRKAEAARREKIQEAFDQSVANGDIKVDNLGNVVDDEGNPVDTGDDVLTWYEEQLAAADQTEDENRDATTEEGVEETASESTDETTEEEGSETADDKMDSTQDESADTADTVAEDSSETTDAETAGPMYAYVDAQGNVLDVTSRYVDLPVLFVEEAGDLKAGDKISEDEDTVDLYSEIVDKLDVIETKFSLIILTKDSEAYLVHNAVAVYLGDVDEIAQKMRRIDYIFPYIENRFGILHMENWTQSNKDIIFQILE